MCGRQNIMDASVLIEADKMSGLRGIEFPATPFEAANCSCTILNVYLNMRSAREAFSQGQVERQKHLLTVHCTKQFFSPLDGPS